MDNAGHDRHDAQQRQVKDAALGSTPPNCPAKGGVDEQGHDEDEAQEQQATDSDSGDAPPGRPDGVVGQEKDPLIEFLRRMHKEQGKNKTAAKLGVDRKTIWRALEAGRLTPRLKDALERERQAAELAAEREAAGGERLELELWVEGLERRLQDVEEQLTGGLGRLGEELAGLRDEVKTLAWTRPEVSGAASESDSTHSTLRSPHRTYPQVVTVEPLPDDEPVFGEAMPLIAEWRDQRERFKAHWPSVEGLEAEVRMLELELELIKERRLTLPPGRLPWEWDQRRREAQRRQQRLGTARRNLRRARWRYWWRRVLGLGTLAA
ncbi:MAG: hypothetical protein OXI41_01875 [Chloroflexota bacterium]|nr:hypothetical protein [Chloroflexota bacterium]MDE2895569.1 hypothetical protein [Chloroflexota bacterium]